MEPLLLKNIADLVTMKPLAARSKPSGTITDSDLGRVGPNAWLACRDGRVLAFGAGNPEPEYSRYRTIDCLGGTVLPGLVDSHTHSVFGGSRAEEFSMRLAGKSYQEIAAAGGGIQSSVDATRAAALEELTANLRAQLLRFGSLGVTTVEVKSGYGLSVAGELRQLQAVQQASAHSQIRVCPTLLALHAIPKEHRNQPQKYIDIVIKELLPQVAESNTARYVDAFIEKGYFSVADVTPYVEAAKDLGLGVRLHADEFSNCGGAKAAAHWGAASADHLQFASDDDAKAMAEAGVVATILPGTSLYTKIPYTSARRFLDAGCPTAIATDFNPGSCMIDDLGFLAVIAALHCGFRLPEAIAAITCIPAHSLGLGDEVGALDEGFHADLGVYPVPSLEDWFWNGGRIKPIQVMIGGAPLKF